MKPIYRESVAQKTLKSRLIEGLHQLYDDGERMSELKVCFLL